MDLPTSRAGAAPELPKPTYKNLTAAKGSMVPFFFAVKGPDWNPNEGTGTDWHKGGFKRGFEASDSFDTIDITADFDIGTGSYRKTLSGFRESTVSVDFVARADKTEGAPTEEATGLKALWHHLKAPAVEGATKGEPYIWIKYFHPVFDFEITQCFTCSSVGDSYAYDDAVTFSAEFSALSAPTITAIPTTEA